MVFVVLMVLWGLTSYMVLVCIFAARWLQLHRQRYEVIAEAEDILKGER